MGESGRFTSETARAASAKAGAKRGHRRSVTTELVLGKALRLFNSTISDKTVPLSQRLQAARAALSTLHDAGVRPSQRDLAIIFQRLAQGDAPQQVDDGQRDE